MTQSSNSDSLVVQATPEEVRRVLKSVLTESQFELLSVSDHQPRRKRFGNKRAGQEMMFAVVKFAGLAIAGNAIYDGAKLAAIQALEKMVGDNKVEFLSSEDASTAGAKDSDQNQLNESEDGMTS